MFSGITERDAVMKTIQKITIIISLLSILINVVAFIVVHHNVEEIKKRDYHGDILPPGYTYRTDFPKLENCTVIIKAYW